MDYSRHFKSVRWWLKNSDKTENLVIVECTHWQQDYAYPVKFFT